MSPIKVLVADDHPLFRQALSRTISSWDGLELVGEACDGAEALEMIERLRPDVAVLDIKMPELDGLAVLSATEQKDLSTRVMLLSGDVDPSVAYEAIAHGAGAFFSKLTDAAHICDAIAAVHEGKTVLPPEIQTTILGEIRERSRKDRPGLTSREKEILQLAAAGSSNPEVAAQLHLSPGTVKTHLRHVYEKLGVSGRVAAVAEAVRRGAISGNN